MMGVPSAGSNKGNQSTPHATPQKLPAKGGWGKKQDNDPSGKEEGRKKEDEWSWNHSSWGQAYYPYHYQPQPQRKGYEQSQKGYSSKGQNASKGGDTPKRAEKPRPRSRSTTRNKSKPRGVMQCMPAKPDGTFKKCDSMRRKGFHFVEVAIPLRALEVILTPAPLPVREYMLESIVCMAAEKTTGDKTLQTAASARIFLCESTKPQAPIFIGESITLLKKMEFSNEGILPIPKEKIQFGLDLDGVKIPLDAILRKIEAWENENAKEGNAKEGKVKTATEDKTVKVAEKTVKQVARDTTSIPVLMEYSARTWDTALEYMAHRRKCTRCNDKEAVLHVFLTSDATVAWSEDTVRERLSSTFKEKILHCLKGGEEPDSPAEATKGQAEKEEPTKGQAEKEEPTKGQAEKEEQEDEQMQFIYGEDEAMSDSGEDSQGEADEEGKPSEELRRAKREKRKLRKAEKQKSEKKVVKKNM
jgi:hypothetical protein